MNELELTNMDKSYKYKVEWKKEVVQEWVS